MTRKTSRPLSKTIVIVCEDTKVTPQYLKGFATELSHDNVWDKISIYPLPAAEKSTVTNTQHHKSPRKQRDFVNTIAVASIEEKYKQVPVRYVREAQLRINEEGYNEAWAVYDKDGHPYHKQAYILSQTVPFVNIAFTSIAIEHWFLLHFENDENAYSKSREVPLAKHITNYNIDKKAATDIFTIIRSKLEIASVNALWLRKSTANTQAFYERNPFINIDKLIFRLFGYNYLHPSETISIRNIAFSINVENDELLVEVVNDSKATLLTDEISFYHYDKSGEPITEEFEREQLAPQNIMSFCFDTSRIPRLFITFDSSVLVIDTTI